MGAQHYAIDAGGNTSQRLDSSGNILETLLCSAYGSLQSNHPSTDPYRGMGAQSGVQLDSTGLYYLPDGRYYDAAEGATLSRNPGGGGGGNGYSPFGLNATPNSTPSNSNPPSPASSAKTAYALNSASASEALRDTRFGFRTAEASNIRDTKGSTPSVSSTSSSANSGSSSPKGSEALSAASASDSRSAATVLDSLASVSASLANVSALASGSMREPLQDALDTSSSSLGNTPSHNAEDVPALGGVRRGHGRCEDPNASDSGDPADTYIPTSG